MSLDFAGVGHQVLRGVKLFKEAMSAERLQKRAWLRKDTRKILPARNSSAQEIGESIHAFHHEISFLPGARLELAWEFNVPTDFKSVASADFAIRAKRNFLNFFGSNLLISSVTKAPADIR